MARGKVKGKVKVSVKKRPLKSGSTNRGGDGGIFVAKTIAIVNKAKSADK